MPPSAPGTLASIQEIGTILGVPKQRASQITHNRGFPRPVDELGVGRIWRAVDVERYKRDHRDTTEDDA